MITFLEQRLDVGYDYGTTGSTGQRKRSTVVTTAGRISRVYLAVNGYGRFELGGRTVSRAHYERIFNFLIGVDGFGFRFKDWADYKAVGQAIGTGDGTSQTWQLKRSYGAVTAVDKDITKIASGTAKIYYDGVLQGVTVDENTGTWTATVGNGVVVTADFEFDKKVICMTDDLMRDFVAFSDDARTAIGINSIVLKEIP